MMFTRCPKCAHQPLPKDQALPASCPVCGVILEKVFQQMAGESGAATSMAPRRGTRLAARDKPGRVSGLLRLQSLLLNSSPSDRANYWLRVALWAAFALWGLYLIGQDYRTGALGTSFIHRPLLIFHEAGHVVFRWLGEWIMVLGGTLGQLLMPAILSGALLIKNRDPFGASLGFWLLGVSLLDIAPYMYDALHPQLMLLSGATGEEGGHDWIYLFSSLGLMAKAQTVAGVVHKLGSLMVLVAIVWGAWVLRRQRVLA